MDKQIGKQRKNNSRNWKEKKFVVDYLSGLGYDTFELQHLVICGFQIDNRPVGCRLIVYSYWDLFKHYVRHTDFK